MYTLLMHGLEQDMKLASVKSNPASSDSPFVVVSAQNGSIG